MATENRRQAVLREIGIQCWFPRTVLPGAGLSHDIGCAPDVQDPPRGQPERGQSEPGQPERGQSEQAQPESRQQIPAALKAALAAGSEGAPIARQPATAPSAATNPIVQSGTGIADRKPEQHQEQRAQTMAATPAADEPALEFGFSWFTVDKRLSVMAMLPPDADRLSSGCGQMLQRILVALSPEFKDKCGQEHTFHWPFSGDLGLPASQQAARQAVNGFVARRLREQPSTLLLILADETPPFLYNDAATSGEDHNGALLIHRQFGFAMLRTHSLYAMESNNELKRSAWQAMQSLRDRLNRGTS